MYSGGYIGVVHRLEVLWLDGKAWMVVRKF